MIRFADNTTDVADILLSSADGGEIRVNLGYFEGTSADNLGIAADSPCWGQFGFVSRPADPDENGACMAFYAVDGDMKRVISTRDNRYISKIGELEAGGCVQFGKTGSFHNISGENGSQTIYVPYAFSGDTPAKAHAISIDVSNDGSEAITIVHGEGMAITMAAGGSNSVVIKNKAGDAYIEINDDGITLNGNVKMNGGVVMADPAGAVPVALSPPLIAAWAALNTALTSTGLPVIGGGGGTAKLASPVTLSASVAATKTSGA